MSIEKELNKRSGTKCELCGAEDGLSVYEIPPVTKSSIDECIHVCETCINQIENPDAIDANHWRCLNDSMWSEVPAVQVMAWRMLNRLKAEAWPQDLLDMLYLDEETLTWAQATGEGKTSDEEIKHMDSNGSQLQAGDTVVLIKDLNVKGAGFTAKRGTAVRGISLVADNAEHIEGRINGQQIVILTKFVKKSN
ncbi:MAG: PhnA protein [Bacteroidales bacterium]|nr:PhnA protein [Bacteroidales bacterium]